ncbi:MAG TPA: HAMP domain-containing sensor histidine kinase [Lacunisphaera sp.]|jgi:signal transduction histidine kinase|nr:HAMP domain-containing sensor histidine kinase [Lacunisphaera sp.]
MSGTTVYLIRLPHGLREVAGRAAQDAFARVRVVAVNTVAEAAFQPDEGRQLLVHAGDDEAEMAAAAERVDEADLPRWAVVGLTAVPSDLVETVPPEDWNVRALSRVFRATMLQHELLRDNLRLRGDLKTIARRVSHDLRTPVGCIHTSCELLKDVRPSETAVLHDTVDVIRRANEEICVMVDRLSALLKATTEPLPPSVVPMGPVVARVLREIRTESGREPIKVRQPSTWPSVLGVPAWIETIWSHLIANAAKHGARTGMVQLAWQPDGPGAVRFSISSPGPLAPESRKRVLRQFHTLHADAAAGIGLSIVERLVTLQYGRAGWTSAGQRTVFHFTLPVADPATNGGGGAPAKSPPKIAKMAR